MEYLEAYEWMWSSWAYETQGGVMEEYKAEWNGVGQATNGVGGFPFSM